MATGRKTTPSWLPAMLLVAAAIILLAAGAVLLPRLTGQTAQLATIGGPFALQDGDGRTVTDRDFRGRWMLVYFGYTHCPDACPTALNDMAAALDRLGADKDKVTPIFITVDPARDTPQVMKDYVSAFGAKIVALSGSPDAVAQAEHAYRVYAAKRPDKAGGYEMDHSSIIYIMNPQGQFVANFTHESDPKAIADKLKQLGV